MSKTEPCPRHGKPGSRPGHVCQHCWRDTPCPVHSKAQNRNWTPERAPDRAKQHKLRQAVLARDNWTCTRCGHHDPTGKTLEAHHVRDGYDPSCAVLLCTKKNANGCHAAVDMHARG